MNIHEEHVFDFNIFFIRKMTLMILIRESDFDSFTTYSFDNLKLVAPFLTFHVFLVNMSC